VNVITYTGVGKGVARLHAIANRVLRREETSLLHPAEFVEYTSTYLEPSELIVYALGNLNDAIKVIDAAKLTGWDVKVVRTLSSHEEFEKRLEPFTVRLIKEKTIVEVMLRAYDFMIDSSVMKSEGVRSKRILEEVEDLEGARRWAEDHVEIPMEFDYIIYTPSMEMAANAIAKVLNRKTASLDDAPSTSRLFILASSAEEHWIRRLTSRGAKSLVINTDPLTAPWYVLLKLGSIAKSLDRKVYIS